MVAANGRLKLLADWALGSRVVCSLLFQHETAPFPVSCRGMRNNGC